METQSTITDSLLEQVERAQPMDELTQCESPRTLVPDKPRVTETCDKESGGAGVEVPIARHSEELGSLKNVVGEPEEITGPSGQHLELVIVKEPRVTVGVPRTLHMDLVFSADKGMLNAIQCCMVEVRAAFHNEEMTDVRGGQYCVHLANTIVRVI